MASGAAWGKLDAHCGAAGAFLPFQDRILLPKPARIRKIGENLGKIGGESAKEP